MLRFYLPALFMLLSLTSCLDLASGCEYRIVKRRPDPSGKMQAIRLLVDCGATTTPSSSIRIIEDTDSSAIGKPENTILSEAAGTDFYWLDRDTLIVTGAASEEIVGARNSYPLADSGHITIIYKK